MHKCTGLEHKEHTRSRRHGSATHGRSLCDVPGRSSRRRRMMKSACLVEASDVVDLVVVHLRVVALVFRRDVDLCSKGTRQS